MISSKVKIVKRVFSNYYDFLHEKEIGEVNSQEDAQLFFDQLRKNNFFCQYYSEQNGARILLKNKQKEE